MGEKGIRSSVWKGSFDEKEDGYLTLWKANVTETKGMEGDKMKLTSKAKVRPLDALPATLQDF